MQNAEVDEGSNVWTPSSQIGLKSVSLTGKLLGRAAEVQIQQRYVNKGKSTQGVVFKFPFPEELGTVIGIEVQFGTGKVISAPVHDNKKPEVNDAQGLVDADFLSNGEDSRELLVISIAAIEPTKEVSVKVSYLTVATMQDGADHLRFTFPTDLSLYSTDEEIESRHELSVKLDLEMPNEIKALSSPTHSALQSKILDDAASAKKKGTVTLQEREALEPADDFVLQVQLVGVPAQVQHESWFRTATNTVTTAAMVTFVPELIKSAATPAAANKWRDHSLSDFVFIIDCSVSMSGAHLQHTKAALEQFLRRLPHGSAYNLITVGSSDTKLFPTSQPFAANDANMHQAHQFISKIESDMIEEISLQQVLTDVFATSLPKDAMRQIVLITFGAVADAYSTLATLRERAEKEKSRLFVLGLGEHVAHHMLHSLARAGSGVAELLHGKDSIERKVDQLMRRALQPRVTNVRVDWGSLKLKLQAPPKLTTLYDNDSVVIMALIDGFLPAQGELTVTLRANGPAGEMSFPVTVRSDQKVKGNMLHRLVTASLLRDMEDGYLAQQDELLGMAQPLGLTSANGSYAITDKSQGVTVLSYRLFPDPDELEVDVDSATPSEPVKPARKQYDQNFLLQFQKLCTEKPKDMPSMDIIIGSTPKVKPQDLKSSSRDGRGKGGRGPQGGRGRDGGGRGGKGGRAPAGTAGSLITGPVAALTPTEGRWTRPARNASGAKDDEIIRKARGLLNKLSRENYDKIVKQIIDLGINSDKILQGLIDLVFDKAVTEVKYSGMYADLCVVFDRLPYGAADDPKKASLFKRLLLTKCQTEFETKMPEKAPGATPAPSAEGTPAAAAAPAGDAAAPTARPTTPSPAAAPAASSAAPQSAAALAQQQQDAFEAMLRAKKRVMGNIRFIGELYKKGMVSTVVTKSCLSKLLAPSVPEEDELEALCQLLNTVGEQLEKGLKARNDDFLEQSFTKIKALSVATALAPRPRFMLLDLLELRANKWVSRRQEAAPTTLAEVHEEAKKADDKAAAESRQALRRSTQSLSEAPSPIPSRSSSTAQLLAAQKEQSGGFVPTDRPVSPAVDGWEVARGSRNKPAAGPSGGGGGGGKRDDWEVAGGGKGGRPNNNSRGGGNISRSSSRDDRGGGRGWKNTSVDQQRGGGGGGAGAGGASASGGDKGGDGRDNKFAALPQSGNNTPATDRRGGGGGGGGGRGGRAGEDRRGAASPPAPAAPTAAAPSAASATPAKPAGSSRSTTPMPAADLEDKFEEIMTDFLSSHDPEDASDSFAELHSADAAPAFVQKAMVMTIEMKDQQRELATKLFAAMHQRKAMSKEQFAAGLKSVVELVPDLEFDSPYAAKFVAEFAAHGLANDYLDVAFVESGFEPLVASGKAAKVVAELLLAAAKLKSDAWVRETILTPKKLDLTNFLKPDQRNAESLKQFLADKEALRTLLGK